MSYKYILPGTVLHYKLLHNAETFLIGNTVAFQKKWIDYFIINYHESFRF